MNIPMIEVNKLEKSPLNARRTVTKGAAEDMKASILAHGGILHNLVVTGAGDGHYRVIDGGRRLEALKALQAEGKLPVDYAVPCQVRSEENALESSLAANTVRLAMHPADEFEAFARLAAGNTAEQIGIRFGKTARYVEQRLKLGNADPKLLKAYREEELTLECLMAFTITDDRKRQMKVYRSLRESRTLNPRSIRASPHRHDGRIRQQAGAIRRAGRLPGSRRHDAGRPVQRNRLPEKRGTAQRPCRRQARCHPAGTDR